MLNPTKLLIFLFLATIGSCCASTFYAFTDPSECVIIAKNLKIAVTPSDNSKCVVETTHSFEAVSVSKHDTRVIIQQLAQTPSTETLEINLPSTCKLSCYMTKGSNIEITNSGSESLAPLSLNLFNGGTVTVKNGTYLAYSVTIHGLGDVTMTDVESQESPQVYINGFGTLRKSQNAFSMGGMSLKNGARAYFGNNVISAGKRTTYTPNFSEVSLEDLNAYTTGLKTHPELPNGWSNTLPDKEIASTNIPILETKKSVVAIAPPIPITKTPPLTPATKTTQQQAIALDASSKAKEEAIRAQEIAEDLKLYGMQIRYLSYSQVKAILVDDIIYKGCIPRELFRINGIYSEYHPYGLDALANRVKYSTATNEQKYDLWTILLFRRTAVVDILVDDFKRVRNVFVHTPNSLWGLASQATSLQSMIRTLKPWFFTTALVIIEGCAYYHGQKNDTAKGIMKKPLVSVLAATAPLTTFLWFYVRGNKEKHRESARNMFVVKTLEECVEKIFYITHAYKDFMPADLVSFVNAFNNKDCQLKNYLTNGKIDLELFNVYHSAVCSFYTELGKKAGILN